jgi:hypothetical protein
VSPRTHLRHERCDARPIKRRCIVLDLHHAHPYVVYDEWEGVDQGRDICHQRPSVPIHCSGPRFCIYT